MKRFFLNMLCVCILAIGLAGCNSPIDSVKNGVLELDKSTTVGKAFDNYSCFKKTSWSEIKTKQGQVVVEFNGILDLTKAFSDYDNFRKVMLAEINKTPIDESKVNKKAFTTDMMNIMQAQNTLEYFKSDNDMADAMDNFSSVMNDNYEKKMSERFKTDPIRKTDTTFIVQFKINKDDSFNIGYIGVIVNGKEYTYNNIDDLTNIYIDKPMDVINGAVLKLMFM